MHFNSNAFGELFRTVSNIVTSDSNVVTNRTYWTDRNAFRIREHANRDKRQTIYVSLHIFISRIEFVKFFCS